MTCQTIRIKRRKFCIGDLRETITLEDRNTVGPDDVDFRESFTDPIMVKAGVKTLMGVDVFDDSNRGGQSASHDFIIRFRAGITQEKWIRWQNERYDILVVEDYDGQRKWLRLRSAFRGSVAKAVNEA